MDYQTNSLIQPKDRGYASRLLEQEHYATSMQPRKYSEGVFQAKFKGLEDGFRSTQEPAILDYEKLGCLSNPGSWDAEIWDGACPTQMSHKILMYNQDYQYT